ncbi:hypothetical protein J2X45_003943 [Caulobacter sp. BE264]|uniref:hypothetical protein n=1 Tax=Caulobacter sp. BE264 TaxID=2817724 RepID=UPI00285A2ECC|nr:hypothetical protein [Caulobacter sp. BE264]MDR7232833.1 hypothetical protein [Caulobacter sp. BE264]
MFKPGDVVLVFSEPANKKKYHLCISLNGCYLYVNSPKAKSYPGDVAFPCADFAFLDPTDSGVSIVSCNVVVAIDDAQMKAGNAILKGTVSNAVLRTLVKEIEDSEILSPDEIEAALNGLGDYL